MLNELYILGKVLEEAEISLKNWHPRFVPLPKNKNIYKVTIGNTSSKSIIHDITPLSATNVEGLRKYATSNGHDFPCFNLMPLVVHDAKSFERGFCKLNGMENANSIPDKELAKKFIKLLYSVPLSPEYIGYWREKLPPGKADTLYAALGNCIHKSAQGLKNALPVEEDSCSLVLALIERLATVSVEEFMQSMTAWLCAHLKRYPDTWDEYKALVVSPKDVSEKRDRSVTSLVVLEYDGKETGSMTHYVANAKTHLKINELLMRQEAAAIKEASARTSGAGSAARAQDAYAASTAKSDDPLWKVTLPVLGTVIGRSMFDDKACQYRYGTIRSASFRIGHESRVMTKSALEWLSAKGNMDKTWGILAAEKEHKELLFAYPSQLGDGSAAIIELLGASLPGMDELVFIKTASKVFTSLYKIQPDLSLINIHIFALRKMDKARTKVVFNRKIDAATLERKVRDWVAAAGNLPPMLFKAWGPEKGSFASVEPETPKPFHLSQCLTRIWGQGGRVSGVNASSGRTIGIDILLMDEDVTGVLRHTFQQFLQRSFNYFMALGDASHKGQVLKTEDLEHNLRYMPSILGLLLYKLGCCKEDYMKSAPFLLGQMLSLADQLHALYCREVRDNQLPGQLLGNALVRTASETPPRSLSLLVQRLPPYTNWAKVYQGEKKGYALHLNQKMGEAANELAQFDLPDRLDEKGKAALLLGYLASTRKQAEQGDIS